MSRVVAGEAFYDSFLSVKRGLSLARNARLGDENSQSRMSRVHFERQTQQFLKRFEACLCSRLVFTWVDSASIVWQARHFLASSKCNFEESQWCHRVERRGKGAIM